MMVEAQTVSKYQKSDMVVFRFVKRSKITYNGVILNVHKSKLSGNIYTIASMEHGMRSFTISEEYIAKKIA